MAFQKGHKFGKGNSNSGRKTKAEELAVIIEKTKQKITHEALVELIKNKLYQHIEVGTYTSVKELGLPVYLKETKEKVDITSGDKPLNEIDGKLLDDIIDSYVKRSKSKSGTKDSTT